VARRRVGLLYQASLGCFAHQSRQGFVIPQGQSSPPAGAESGRSGAIQERWKNNVTIGRVDERSEIHRRRWWTTLRLSTDHPLRIGCFWTVPYSQEIRRSNLSDNRSRPPASRTWLQAQIGLGQASSACRGRFCRRVKS